MIKILKNGDIYIFFVDNIQFTSHLTRLYKCCFLIDLEFRCSNMNFIYDGKYKVHYIVMNCHFLIRYIHLVQSWLDH